MKQTITRTEMAARFEQGMERKRAEKQVFLLKAFEEPEKGPVYQELCDFLDYEIRYYEVAAAYYRNDYEGLQGDDYDALLYLTKLSDPSPKVYAQYLREVDRSARDEEKVTHDALKVLKTSIRQVMERGGA